jgi:tetratricopeptide (TPR) repeat protein
MYAASEDWEHALAEYRKLVTDESTDGVLLNKLAAAYQSAGRTREGVPFLARLSVADPKDTILSMKVAALQAWFGQEKEYAATRQRILEFARDTKEATTADRAAKASSFLPSTDKAELEATLALGRSGVELGKGGGLSDWLLLSCGMAEYRSGNYAAAAETLLDAATAGAKNPHITGPAAFYRAMSLFRQGKKDEARDVATAAVAKMKPLPQDEQNPLASNADHDDLNLWLAYKEAKALIGFDESPPTKPENDKK